MKPRPDERREAIRRFGYAVRSKPAAPADGKRPGDLVAGSHSRSYLPHIKAAGGTYFVTFRLTDSLPREVVARLKARSDAAARRTQDSEAKRAAERDYFRALEGALDSGCGACWLRRPEIADLVAGALRHFDGDRYRLSAWVVMPNHVHVVVTPLPGITLSSILHSWKAFTAKEANKLLPEKVEGEFWQRESYDHWCRDAEEVARCVRYVEGNPVKANLCRDAEAWAWSSAYTRGRLEACDTAGGDACATPRRP
ncbi:MAG: putative methylase [Chthoniobacter sp.]|nr:putative methylase [Chthoniobacter sp.]